MRTLNFFFLLVFVVFYLSSTAVFGDSGLIVWTPDTGEVNIETLPRITPLQRFAYARALAGAGQFSDAIRELKRLIDRYPDEVFVEQADAAIIVCLWQGGSHRRAYKACWRFLRKYPASVLVPDIERMRLLIAVDLSYKNPSAAIGLLEELLETSKFEEQSADALRYIGDCYFRLKRYEEARDSYKELIEDYPKSVWVPYAYFRMGLSDFVNGFRQMRDFGLMRRAMTEFHDYLEEYSSISPRPEIRKYMKKLEEFQAHNFMTVARFYEKKRDKPEAAAIYLERLVTLYPGSRLADDARKKLLRLKKKHVIRPEQVVREVPF